MSTTTEQAVLDVGGPSAPPPVPPFDWVRMPSEPDPEAAAKKDRWYVLQARGGSDDRTGQIVTVQATTGNAKRVVLDSLAGWLGGRPYYRHRPAPLQQRERCASCQKEWCYSDRRDTRGRIICGDCNRRFFGTWI